MNPTLLARRRSERRRQQGGVAMFIVSMMMTVLATVGLFALAAASTEMKTAGNERQNTQTHYLAEYGVVAIAHEVDSVKVGTYLGLMFVQPRTTCQFADGGVHGHGSLPGLRRHSRKPRPGTHDGRLLRRAD